MRSSDIDSQYHKSFTKILEETPMACINLIFDSPWNVAMTLMKSYKIMSDS
jgi:hypothetical protein